MQQDADTAAEPAAGSSVRSRASAHGRCPAISLVLPAYNEEATIARAIREAVSALSGLARDFEVVVVDDGSSDHTSARAGEEAARHRSVRVVRLPENRGYGAALRHGFALARYDLLAFTDADCQFDLTQLDRLLFLADSYDLVCGYRIARRDGASRIWISRLYGVITRLLLGTGVRDCDCALKVFRRSVFQAVSVTTDGFFFNAELLARARLANKTVVEVGVAHRPRAGGNSTVSFGQAWPLARDLLRFWWTNVAFPDRSSEDVLRGTARTAWEKYAPWMLACAAALLLLARLNYPLIEPDESRYAQIALEMIERGDAVTPTLDGHPYLDKPPLLYWLTAASYQLFGISRRAARLPTAAAAWLTVVATFSLGKRIVGYRSALCGATALLLSAGFVLAGRFLIMDSLLALFSTVTLASLYLAVMGPAGAPSRRPRQAVTLGWCLLAGLATGAGLLAKGPIIGVLCLPPIGLAWWLGERHGLPDKPVGGRSTALVGGLVFAGAAMAVALPWFVAVAEANPQFFRHFLWTHHVVRFVHAFNHRAPWWFYVPVLMAGMFPCSMLMPALIAGLCGNDRPSRRWRTPGVGFLLLAAVWMLAFLSLSSCKLPTYALPMLPPLCLVLGALVDRVLLPGRAAGYLGRVGKDFPRVATDVLLGGAGALSVVGLWLGNADLLGWLTDAGLLALAGGWLAYRIRLSRPRRDGSGPRPAAGSRPSAPKPPGAQDRGGGGGRGRFSRGMRWATATAVGLGVTAYGFGALMPKIADRRSTAAQAARLQAALGNPRPPVVYFERPAHAVALALERPAARRFSARQIDALRRFLDAHPATVLVTRAAPARLARLLGPKFQCQRAATWSPIYITRHRAGRSRAAREIESVRR